MSYTETAAFSPENVEDAARKLAEVAVTRRQIRSIQKHASPMGTALLGLGGAGVGGLLGGLKNLGKDEEERHTGRDVLTGALAGGALGTGVGLAGSAMGYDDIKELPKGVYNGIAGGLRKITPDSIKNNPDLVAKARELQEPSTSSGIMGMLKFPYKAFVGQHPILGRGLAGVAAADLASNAHGSIAANLPSYRGTLDVPVFRRALKKFMIDPANTGGLGDDTLAGLKGLGSEGDDYLQKMLHRTRQGKPSNWTNAAELKAKGLNPKVKEIGKDVSNHLAAMRRQVEGNAVTEPVAAAMRKAFKSFESSMGETANKDFINKVVNAKLRPELIREISGHGGARKGFGSAVGDIAKFVNEKVRGKSGPGPYWGTGFNAAGKSNPGRLAKALRNLEGGAATFSKGRMSRLLPRLGLYAGLPLAWSAAKGSGKDVMNSIRLQNIQRQLSEKV